MRIPCTRGGEPREIHERDGCRLPETGESWNNRTDRLRRRLYAFTLSVSSGAGRAVPRYHRSQGNVVNYEARLRSPATGRRSRSQKECSSMSNHAKTERSIRGLLTAVTAAA